MIQIDRMSVMAIVFNPDHASPIRQFNSLPVDEAAAQAINPGERVLVVVFDPATRSLKFEDPAQLVEELRQADQAAAEHAKILQAEADAAAAAKSRRAAAAAAQLT